MATYKRRYGTGAGPGAAAAALMVGGTLADAAGRGGGGGGGGGAIGPSPADPAPLLRPLPPPFALPNPGRLVVPEVLVTGPNQEAYLASVLSHVADILAYLTRVRATLLQTRDSALRREYVQAERERLTAHVAALREHELFLNPFQYPHPYMPDPLRGYVIDCMYKLQEAKAWALSNEVFQLINGIANNARTLVRRPVPAQPR
jgi:hypothetical protein